MFAVYGHPNASVLTYYGLFALQHRGQESAGIVSATAPGAEFQVHKGMGLCCGCGVVGWCGVG